MKRREVEMFWGAVSSAVTKLAATKRIGVRHRSNMRRPVFRAPGSWLLAPGREDGDEDVGGTGGEEDADAL